MKRQLKIIGTMIAIVLFMFGFSWTCATYPNFIIWFFGIIGGLVGLFIFYAGVSSFFEDQN